MRVTTARNVLGAFEHHVFKEMSEAGVAYGFVGGAHVVPDIDGDEREAVIFGQNDLKAVVELVFLEFDLGDLQGLGLGGGSLRVEERKAEQDGQDGGYTKTDGCFHK
jgi:hypothetical protein